MFAYRQSSSGETTPFALAKLQKIALGANNDAIKLAFMDAPDADALAQLDLSAISEIRKTKDGFDMKFFNRLEALKILLTYEQTALSSDADSLLETLNQSACQLQAASESDALHEM